MKKQSDVVMLPTNKASQIILSKVTDKLFLNNSESEFRRIQYAEYQHLYILSDDKIKKGDAAMIIDPLDINYGYTCRISYESEVQLEKYKKVVASTDKELGLGEPSESFIQKFVEKYNKGEVIEKAMVEYEEYLYNTLPDNGINSNIPILIPKLRRDNTIIISECRVTFTERELQIIAQDFAFHIQHETIQGRFSEGIATGWHEWFKNYDLTKLNK